MQAHHTREMHITELLFEGVDKEEVPEKQITELGVGNLIWRVFGRKQC